LFTQAAETSGDGTYGAGAGVATADLANVDTSAYAGQAAGIGIDGTLVDAVDHGDLADALSGLKALGNANPDVNVTAVQNGHGTWTWTARAAEDGRKLAVGGPHHANRLAENLQLLFSGSTIALHATGVQKTRRLN
jgi:phage tail sheath gpL-like